MATTNSQTSAGVQNTPKPKTPPDMLDLLLFIQQVYSSEKLENAISACKEGKVGCDIRAREALFELAENAFFKHTSGRLQSEVNALKQSIDELKSKVSSLHDRATADDLGTFLVRGTLSTRYENEHTEEKKALTRYVAQTFFPDEKIYAFLQASVTSIYLARAIAERTIRPGSLFYTNSIVIPLILLQNLRHVSVYTVCGTEYDSLCGGWLPRMDDDGARAHMANLFTRPLDKICDSFFTPIAVTCDTGGLFFTRPELTQLLNTVVPPSRQLVIMTVSSRVYPNRDAAQKAPPLINTTLEGVNPFARPAGAKPPQLVVSFDKNDGKSETERKQSISQLTNRGFDVHWQSNQGKWELFQTAPKV